MAPRAGGWLALLIPLSAAGLAAEETLLQCRAISSDSLRLACYDDLADRTQGPIVPPPPSAAEGGISSQAVPESRPQTEQSFGRPPATSSPRESGSQILDRIEARIASVERGADRLFRIALDNGQVWKQVESGSARFREGEPVEIKVGALGAYYLRREGQGRLIRVKRVR